jgi:uncharacterized protein YlxW (UPF0749 family)
MSTIGEAWAAIRKVVLIEANLARLEKDVEALASEIRRTRDYAEAVHQYAMTIDRRVAVLEGTVKGYNMARGMPPALPEE